MGTPVVTKPPTPRQRATDALQRAARYLAVDNEKLLVVALTELAVDAVMADRAFAGRVQARYNELNAKPVRATPSRQPRPAKTGAGLRPKPTTGRTPGDHVDIVSPIDPRTLVPLYGPNLQAHLAEYSVRALWQMARVLAGPVGKKAPPQTSGAEVLIAYILRHVAN